MRPDTPRLGEEMFPVLLGEAVRDGHITEAEASTFVIDADGNVARAMYGVKPEGHADKVLEALPGQT